MIDSKRAGVTPSKPNLTPLSYKRLNSKYRPLRWWCQIVSFSVIGKLLLRVAIGSQISNQLKATAFVNAFASDGATEAALASADVATSSKNNPPTPIFLLAGYAAGLGALGIASGRFCDGELLAMAMFVHAESARRCQKGTSANSIGNTLEEITLAIQSKNCVF